MPSPFKPPKAIIFDLLTALLDSWSLWSATSPATGLTWRKHYLDLTYGSTVYGPGTAYEELVARAAAESGTPASAAETLIRKWGDLEAWPETGEVLVKLRARGYKLGVVTNCSAELGKVAVRVVEEAASSQSPSPSAPFRFDAAATAEEAGFYKPSIHAYHSVLPALGVRPQDVLFVAGSAGDVVGARAAGFRVVWHNRVGLEGKEGEGPEREGRSLDEVLGEYL